MGKYDTVQIDVDGQKSVKGFLIDTNANFNNDDNKVELLNVTIIHKSKLKTIYKGATTVSAFEDYVCEDIIIRSTRCVLFEKLHPYYKQIWEL